MKGDFSRFTFQPDRHFTSVLLQQGRVQTDADWNEQMEIVSERFETGARDVIGACGAPAGTGGFDVKEHPALVFSQTGQRVSVASREAFAFHGREHFTLEAWVCPEELCPGKTCQDTPGGGPILSVSGPGNSGYWLQLESDGRISFHRVETRPEEIVDVEIDEFEIGDTEVIVGEISEAEVEQRFHRIIYSADRVPTGQFTRITVCSEGYRTAIRIDGRLSAMRRCGKLVASAHDLLIGSRGAEFDAPFFNGAIGGVRVWKRAVDEREDPGIEEANDERRGLELWLPMSDGKGDIAADHSGHDRNGRLESPAGTPLPSWTRTVWVQPGRYYVHGMLCQNERPIRVDEGPDSERESSPDTRLLYLEVSERTINAIEDPHLRDVALGGADTAVRLQTVWRLGLLPVRSHHDRSDHCDAFPEWRRLTALLENPGAMAARAIHTVNTNQLYRVEIQSGAIGAAATWDPGDETLRLESGAMAEGWAVGDLIQLIPRGSEHSSESGFASIVAVNPAAGTLQIDKWPWPSESEKTRVSMRRVPTFKWSRDNGSVTLPVTAVDAEQRIITIGGSGGDWSVTPGDWVELSDADTRASGHPQPLLQISAVERSASNAIVTFSGVAPIGISGDQRLHPMLRRWDQKGSGVNQTTGAITAQPKVWIDIEDGIQVKFDNEIGLLAGDYWAFPSRARTGSIEWPVTDDKPVALAPRGPQRHVCGLALIHFEQVGPVIRHRYRQTFLPLTVVKHEEGEFVHRTGDTMTGPLTIEAPLTVQGSLEVDSRARLAGGARIEDGAEVVGRFEVQGHAHLEDLHVESHTTLRELHVRASAEMAEVSVELLRGTLAPDIVGTPQLRDRSVTIDKLAFPLPSGGGDGCVLRDSPQPILGYRYTGCHLVVPDPDPVVLRNRPPRLFAGDVYAAASGSLIYLLSGEGILCTFDPASGNFAERASMPGARREFAFVAVGGKLCVVGGADSTHHPPTLIYDCASDSWSRGEPLPRNRTFVQVVSRGSILHALGGKHRRWYGSEWTRDHELYDPVHDMWTTLRRMPERRAHFAAAELNGRVYATGGSAPWIFFGGRTRMCEMYDPATDSWSRRQHMPRPLSRHAADGFAGRLITAGSQERKGLGETAEYLPGPDLWRTTQPIRLPRDGVTLVAVGNRLFGVSKSPFGREGAGWDGRPFIWPAADAWYVFRPDLSAS